MSTTVTLLGLGHFAGVLGRLHAAALVAPEAPHHVVARVSAPASARLGARRPSTLCRGAVRLFTMRWAAL